MGVLVLLVGLSQPAQATEVGVGGYVGVLAPAAKDGLDPFGLGGVRLRYRWEDRWGLEGAFGIGTDGYTDPRIEVLRFMGSPAGKVNPFLAGGVGLMTRAGDPTRFLADAGLGIDSELFPVLDFRADARVRLMAMEKATTALVVTAGLQVHNPRVRDQDGDGVADGIDACPGEAEDVDGWADADGCPDDDNDADGVPDTTDTCPAEPEDVDQHADADGCPDPDDDGDGVVDVADRCRDAAEDVDGFQDEDGCPDPDNDGDGVPDGSDKCRDEAETLNGFRDKDGCPDEVPAEVKKFSGKIEGITFETGKAVIRKDSNKVLDAAVAVLLQYPEVRMEVQGHTDDVGDDAKNLKLSQDRAQAVVTYFVAKGVAADRLVAKGYGETHPMVPNDSTANRSQNRRVEFLLLP